MFKGVSTPSRPQSDSLPCRLHSHSKQWTRSSAASTPSRKKTVPPPAHAHHPALASPDSSLHRFWNNLRTHYFPPKQDLLALLSSLSKHLLSLRPAPSLAQLLLEPYQGEPPLPGGAVILRLSQVLSPEYLASKPCDQRAYLLQILSATQLESQLMGRGLLSKAQSWKIRKLLDSSRGRVKKTSPCQSLANLIFRLIELKPEKPIRDQIYCEIQTQAALLGRAEKANARALQQLTLQANSAGSSQPCNKPLLRKYFQSVLRTIESKQLAQSISHIDQLKQQGKGHNCVVHFEMALGLPPRRMALRELTQLDKGRENSLFRYYSVGQKTRYSVMSSYLPAIQRLLAHPTQPIAKDRSVLEVPAQDSSRKNSLNMCHQCRNLFSTGFLLQCRRGAPKSCGRFYCAGCLKVFDCRFEEACPFCEGYCCCTRCQRDELSSRIRSLLSELNGQEWREGSETAEVRQEARKRLRSAAKGEAHEPGRRKRARYS